MRNQKRFTLLFAGAGGSICPICGLTTGPWRGCGVSTARGWLVCERCARERAPKLWALAVLAREVMARPELADAISILRDGRVSQ